MTGSPQGRSRAVWAGVLALAVLVPVSARAKKPKKSKEPEPAKAAAPAQTAPKVDTWGIYEAGLALAEAGDIDAAAAKFETASVHPSDPIVWCYSRLQLADVYFRQGNRDAAARAAKYAAARERFLQALLCVADPGRDPAELRDWEREAGAQLGEEEKKAIEAFRPFGTDDLAQRLEKLAEQQATDLVENGAFAEAAEHGRFLVEVFGPSRQRLLGVALACIEQGDLECAAAQAVTAQQTGRGDPTAAEPIEVVVKRALELAEDPGGSAADGYIRFSLDLLSQWHELEPLDREPREMLAGMLLPLERPERLRRLKLTDDCWPTTFIVERLRDERRDFLEEARLASACGGGNAESREMLAEVHYQKARTEWNSLRRLSQEDFNVPERVQRHMAELAPVLDDLKKSLAVDDAYQPALDLKAKVTAYLDQMGAQRKALVDQERAELQTYCRQKWGSFTWWADRRFELLSQTPAAGSFEEFESECARFLETEKLQSAARGLRKEIDESRSLLRCQQSWTEIQNAPGKQALERFERECAAYVEAFDIKDALAAAKRRVGA